MAPAKPEMAIIPALLVGVALAAAMGRIRVGVVVGVVSPVGIGVASLAAVSYCPLLPANRQISNPDNPLHQQK